MTFILNGEERDGPAGMTLADLIADLELAHQRLAVEVNEDVIPRSAFADHVIEDGDRIEVVSFVGGG